MKHASRLSFALLGILVVMPVSVHAANQTILGNSLGVFDTSTPDKRKVSLSAKEKASPNTIVGDVLANGATLNLRLTGLPVAGESFNLPSGISTQTGKPFWSGDAVKGFKYKDAKGENGPVASAALSTKGGTFALKVTITSKFTAVATVPPNPGADGCALFTIGGGGDSYSVNFASGKPNNKGAKSFKISKPTAEGTCVVPNPNNMPIEHVVMLMQENRSTDTYLAQLNGVLPAFEAEPTTGNPDPTNPLNPPIVPFHKTTYCEVQDLDHSWKGTHAEVHNGLMDGFTARNASGTDLTGSRAMGYYDQTDLPYYFALYSTFATSDRYFSSVQTQTFPNRLYFLAGSSFGFIRNDAEALIRPSIFNLLDDAGVTWRIYASQAPLAYGSILFKYVSDHQAVRVFPIAQYYADLAAGNLPQVAYVDPDYIGTPKTENDEHPIANVQLGQKFVADVLNALMASSAWATTAAFLTYDEHGGFYDHVPPPAAPVPDAILPQYLGGDPHQLFDEYGVRVPVVVISPYSKPASVTHVVNDHTSILRFVETRFGLPSLTNRDALANPMLEFFDFNTPYFAIPPSLPAAVIDPVQLAACP
jgi:phospholipase C